MKPVEPPQPAVTPEPILDRLRAVDGSSIDQLLSIREEQHRIHSFRSKAEELKDKVATVVHARVIEDYQKRDLELRRRSGPLEQHARAEYQKLRVLLDEADRNETEARLQKEELEFRHAVGELDSGELQERLKTPLSDLQRCGADRVALDGLAGRFTQALGPELLASPPKTDVAATSAGASSTPVPASSTVAPAAVTPQSAGAPAATSTTSANAPPLIQLDPEAEFLSEKTMLVSDVTNIASPAALAQLTRAAVGTQKIPQAALLLKEESGPSRVYRLVATNGIGRAPDNDIQIVKPGISRTHATVNLQDQRFMVRDLDSQNGTFVNGKRVSTHQLSDGDLVDVGTVQFEFRMPWPAADAPKPVLKTGPKR